SRDFAEILVHIREAAFRIGPVQAYRGNGGQGAVPLLGSAEGRFGRLARGDIPDNRQLRALAAVLEGDGSGFGLGGTSVLAEELEIHGWNFLARVQLPHPVGYRFPAFGMEETQRRQLHQLRRILHAVKSQAGAVYEFHFFIHHHGDHVRGQLHELAVFFLAFAHRGFRALAIGDVHHGPENADRIPFFPAQHVAALVDMPEPFRAAPEAVFPDPGVHFAIGGLAERIQYALPVLGMESFLPGLQAWDRVRAAAEQLAGAIVPPGFAGGGLELPNRIVGSPGDEFETVDALAQYFPVPALLGDVHE